MSLPALHMLAPVIGFDAHLVLFPSPAGPVPQMVPLVFLGILFDPKAYRPSGRATVLVNGIPRVHASSPGIGRHVPTLGKFAKKPANAAEVLLGASTVSVQGEPMGYGPIPLSVLTCHDLGGAAPPAPGRKRRPTKSLMLPTAMAIPIQYTSQVFVGGTPTASLSTLAQFKKPVIRRLCALLRNAKSTKRLARELHKAPKYQEAYERARDLWESLPPTKTSF